MKSLFTFVLCACVLAAFPVLAGEMTNGVSINGGQNAFAQLTVNRADGVQEEGLLTLVVSVEAASSLKGYGFVLNYDADRYELVKTREVGDGLLNTGSGENPLFISSNRDPGKIAVGAMKIDGESANGEGRLVELTFRTDENPLPTDFQITEGILVDLEGGVDAISNIEIGNLKLTPRQFSLDQNVPNPFNPSTSISYQLPESGQVRVVIYNLLGQQIKTLVNDRMDAGFYTATWDGNDDAGRQVASGIYLYRMQSGIFSRTQRMMLLK